MWPLICVAGTLGTKFGRFVGSTLDRNVARNSRWLLVLAFIHVLLGLWSGPRLATALRFSASAVASVSGLDVLEPAGAEMRADAVAALFGCSLGSAGPLIWEAAWRRRGRARRKYSAVLTTKRHGAGTLFAVAAIAAATAALLVRHRRKRNRRRLQQHEEERGAGREGEDVQPLLPVAAAAAAATSQHQNQRRRRIRERDVPELYVQCCGSREAAAKRWERTFNWRRENSAERSLREPQPMYNAIKNTLYPHYLHGRTLKGELVMWELLGCLDTAPLRSGQVTSEHTLRHFIFVHEFISRKFEGEATRLVTILDVSGLRFSEVNSFLIRLISTTSKVVENLVPFRASKIYVVNAPSWFGAVFGGIRRALPGEIRDKIEVLGPNFADRLAPVLESMPAEYGGDVSLGQHEDELAMLEISCVLNAGGNAEALLPPLSSQEDDDEGGPSEDEGGRRGDVEEAKIARGDDGHNARAEQSSASATASSRSRFSWLPRLRRDPQVKRAHLGNENRFYYDSQTQQWIFEDEEDEEDEDDDDDESPRPRSAGSGRRRRRQATSATDSDSEDERALVAAIEAATLRRSLANDPQAMRAFVHSQSVSSSSCSSLQAGLVAGLCLSRFSRSLLAVGLWPWLLAPASRGGLGLRVGDVAICCTLGCLFLLALVSRCSDLLRRMPRDAPLRAFRVAVGGTFLVGIAAPELAPSLGGGVGITGELPRDSTAVLVTATATIALLLLFSHLAVAAANAAVRLADGDPKNLLATLAGLVGDLSGPPCSAYVVKIALSGERTHFPFNASAGIFSVALLNATLYLLSFLVYKKVVGDVAGARATCAALLELPARDLQRCAFLFCD